MKSKTKKEMKGTLDEAGFKEAVSVTVHRISEMTPTGRARIGEWLHNLASDLVDEPDAFADKFVARYMYKPKKCGGRRPKKG